MRVLIAGCGYVGTALGHQLLMAGHEVVALRRDPSGLDPGLGPVAADLLDGPGLRRVLPPGLDAVVHLTSAANAEAGSYRDAYVRGLENLLDALPSGVGRVLHASSTGVYGQRDGSVVDETSPTEPTDENGQILLAGEALLHDRLPDAVVVRFGGIYGPGRRSMLDRIARGQGGPAPGPPRYTNRIHRDDCAGVLRHLLQLPTPQDCYLGVDDDPAAEAEVVAWVAERLGVPVPPPSPPRAGSRRARGNRRCSNARLRASGYAFAYPSFREGYAALLAGP